MDSGKWELKTFTQPIMIAFFMLLGYLEAGWLGSLAGLILYAIAITTILIALVPFGGAYLWYNSYNFLASYLLIYLPISNTIYVVQWVMMFIAILLTVATSSLVVTGIGLGVYYGRPKKKLTTGISSIDALIQSFPTTWFKGMNWGSFGEIINKAIDEIMKLWDKLNQKLIGSGLVFLGVGIASHDFWWENTEWNPTTSRPTHGAYEGLQITLLGMQIIVADKPLSQQIKMCLLGYLGVGICYIGFFLMQFIPKGISRIVNHFLWWSGIALIMYNWYVLMQPDLIKYQAKKRKV